MTRAHFNNNNNLLQKNFFFFEDDLAKLLRRKCCCWKNLKRRNEQFLDPFLQVLPRICLKRKQIKGKSRKNIF